MKFPSHPIKFSSCSIRFPTCCCAQASLILVLPLLGCVYAKASLNLCLAFAGLWFCSGFPGCGLFFAGLWLCTSFPQSSSCLCSAVVVLRITFFGHLAIKWPKISPKKHSALHASHIYSLTIF